MKAYSIASGVFVILLSLILSSWFNRVQVEGRVLPQVVKSTSGGYKDLRADKNHHPYKEVDSSFRRIPPSNANPTQNK